MANDRKWRNAYEAYSSAAWLAAAGWTLHLGGSAFLASLSALLTAATAGYGIYRGFQALDIWKARLALLGEPVSVVTPAVVQSKMRGHPDEFWLGYGFDWSTSHRQRLYDLEKIGTERLISPWMRWLRRKGPSKGSPLVHGVEPEEHDVYIKTSDMAGHAFIPATTGAIKTRLLSLLALQAVLRDPKQCVIVLDPKGDPELLQILKWACKAAGRENEFNYLHPAFAKRSVRLDLLKNWSTTTEGASRVAEMMGGSAESAPFKAFGWQAINNIIQGMLEVGARPQLISIRRYLEGGPDSLIRRVIEAFLESKGHDAHAQIQRHHADAKKVRGRAATTPIETVAAILCYKREFQETTPSLAVDGLLTMYEHDSAHFTKMISTLLPILSMLTSDELGALLSPDYNDASDERPILDLGRIVRTGQVLYVGLHSMPDATVSAAIGSLLLADLAAVLGERFVRNELEPKVILLLDEANEVVNPPLVSILNKGRGAGLLCFFFTQTVPDFIAKYGSEAPARQLLGNANSLIAGRSTDDVTIEYIVEKFDKTILQSAQEQFSVNPVAGDRDVTNYHASYGIKHTDLQEYLVPPKMLGMMPDLEYIARFPGRPAVKGRIPVVMMES